MSARVVESCKEVLSRYTLAGKLGERTFVCVKYAERSRGNLG